jgi:hypothetical protein
MGKVKRAWWGKRESQNLRKYDKATLKTVEAEYGR